MISQIKVIFLYQYCFTVSFLEIQFQVRGLKWILITFLKFISEAALKFVYTVYLIILLHPISSNANIKKILYRLFVAISSFRFY